MQTIPPVLPARRAPRAPVSTLPLTRDVSFAYYLTLASAALLGVSSIAGLRMPHTLYGNDAMLPALVAQDVVAIVFGVPLLITSATLARRGSTRGLLCWMGALFYIAYFWYFYVVGVRFNALFPVYIALVSMSLFGVLNLFFALDLDWLRASFDERLPARAVSVFLMVTALAFFFMWGARIYSSLRGGTEIDLVSRYVIAIDGVVLLPLSFFGGLWLWQRQALGYALAGLLLVKMVATFLTLIVTTIGTVRAGQVVSSAETIAYSIGLVVAAGSLVLCLHSVDE